MPSTETKTFSQLRKNIEGQLNKKYNFFSCRGVQVAGLRHGRGLSPTDFGIIITAAVEEKIDHQEKLWIFAYP